MPGVLIRLGSAISKAECNPQAPAQGRISMNWILEGNPGDLAGLGSLRCGSGGHRFGHMGWLRRGDVDKDHGGLKTFLSGRIEHGCVVVARN